MVNAVLAALVIIFIIALIVGLIVYTVFFAIHKNYFRKHLALIKKFNTLTNGLNGINIFKIQVLASNDIGQKLDLKKYIDIYKKLKQNLVIIKSNLVTSELELNSFNLDIAKRHNQIIERDLDKALSDLNELQKGYTNYTQYGQTIEETFQNYLDIYETLTNFYETKLSYKSSFKKINALFISVRKTFETIPSLSREFDYKKTVDTILDLGRKLKTLANAILLVYRFQVVETYLLTTKQYNEKMVSKYYEGISSSDLQTLQNLLTIFNHAFKSFNRYYKSLELGKASSYAIQALNAINQVNQFTYVHINTPTLISLGLNEIKEQTDRILSNKNEILDSMYDLKQYFVLEPQVIGLFNTIEKNVKHISILNTAANKVNYLSHSEKIRAIKDLDAIANQILISKTQIVDSMDQINDLLSNVIKTVTDLNDLYICYWQLFAFVKKLSPNNDEAKAIINLIKSNLRQIDVFSKQIIDAKKPDFDQIAYELSSIIDQSQQIYKQLTTTYILKTYASKLFIYVNRYKVNKTLKKDFEAANKLFKDKQYSQCIDKLLSIMRIAKR